MAVWTGLPLWREHLGLPDGSTMGQCPCRHASLVHDPRTRKQKPQQTEPSVTQVVETPLQPEVPTLDAPKSNPNPMPRAPSLGESAKQLARGFGKGVRDEAAQTYRDLTELPQRVATTGRELIEDIQAGRKLRALAPVEALGHAIQNASREDVLRIAHDVVDGAVEWYHKPAYEKGESLGHATVSVASDVAIAALTDGLGSVAALRKAEKVAEAADHVRDAERALHSSRHAVVPYDPRFAAQQILGESPVTPKGRMITTHAAERMTTPPIGRAQMTTAEVDEVLDKGDRIKKLSHHRDGDTITIQSTTMPGKPQVVVDAATGNRVITVIKNSK